MNIQSRRTRTHVGEVWGWMKSPWALLITVTWAVMIASVLRPVADVDAFWHVLVGYDIVQHHRYGGDPAWVYGPHDRWTTTQWLSEVVMAGFHAALGWAGLMVFTALCGIALLAALMHSLRVATAAPVHGTPITAGLFAITGFAFSIDLQERPASISFVFLAVLSTWAWRALAAHTWPRWWVMAAFTLLWAQLHGYWIMVPLTVTAVLAVQLLTRSTSGTFTHAIRLVLVTAAVGVATPATTYAYIAPLTFREAAAPFVKEWQPPTIHDPAAWIFGALVLAFIAAIATTRPLPYPQLGWILGWTVFAALAYRNVLPATVLVLPAVASACTQRWQHRAMRLSGSSLTRAATLLTATATLAAIGHTCLSGHALRDDNPTHALALLTSQPGERRVLNHYDVGGQVLAFTRPGIRLAIDSRSDMYGRDRIQRYFDLLYTRPGWQHTLAEYNPTDALLKTTDPLNRELDRLGWTQLARDDHYVLWSAPH